MFKRITCVVVAANLALEVAAASPTGWDPRVIPTGEYRELIQSTPIQRRPGRPFHFYGNAVRYRHLTAEQSESLDAPVWNRPVTQVVIGTDRLRDEVGR